MTFLQRLFTTFAGGWAGFGLLAQRLVIGIALLHGSMALFKATENTAGIVPQALAGVLAVFFLLGLWTPVAGMLIATVEIWIALIYPDDLAAALLIASFSMTLAMIGPGAFSIDAKLFGRKHIVS